MDISKVLQVVKLGEMNNSQLIQRDAISVLALASRSNLRVERYPGLGINFKCLLKGFIRILMKTFRLIFFFVAP